MTWGDAWWWNMVAINIICGLQAMQGSSISTQENNGGTQFSKNTTTFHLRILHHYLEVRSRPRPGSNKKRQKGNCCVWRHHLMPFVIGNSGRIDLLKYSAMPFFAASHGPTIFQCVCVCALCPINLVLHFENLTARWQTVAGPQGAKDCRSL
jgi:hypothetical protein